MLSTSLKFRCLRACRSGEVDLGWAMSSETPKQQIDLTGLKCPLPVLKARRAIKDLGHGDVLEVWADDPAAQLDFPHFCETSGHELIQADRHETEDGIRLVFQIKVASS